MPRAVVVLALTLLVTGCPSYDRYSPVVDQQGYVPADQFARYGAEQAQAIAIGRAFGAAFVGDTPADYLRQAETAAAYARQVPGVIAVKTDSVSYVLTVTFRSGWKKAITPIMDGVPADRTKGLPRGN